jgi:pimeloyl-ACP methyl ester carboxylesterase
VRHRPQRVRLEFLIILTVVVMGFGVLNLLRIYRRGQERTNIARTEQQVRVYTGEAQRAETELAQFARDERGSTGRDAAALLAQVHRLEELSALPATRRPNAELADEFARVQQNLRRIQAGLAAVFPQGEPFLRACYSPADGSLLPYGVFVPKGYSDESSTPLIVTLADGSRDQDQFQATPRYGGAISVLSAPRRMNDHGGIGVEELVALLLDVSQSYNIDPQRVYLVGRERGADAAWRAAVSYPELFAGLVLQGITKDCPPVPPVEPAPLAQPRQAPGIRQMVEFVSRSLCPGTYVGNLARVRVVILQSAGADRTALETARMLADRLRAIGVSAEYLEFPLAPAEPFPVWTQQYALAAVMSHAGTLRPDSIDYRTASIRNRYAWWVRLDALGDDPARFATVSGKVQDGVAEIETGNVSALTVVPERLPPGVRAIRVDGIQFSVPAAPQALSRRGDLWRTRGLRGPVKREGLSGPFSDVLRDRFLIVYGTAGDDGLRKQLVLAEALRFAAEWRRCLGLNVTIKADGDVDDADRLRMNLLLFGGPAVNSVSAQIAGSLPVRLDGGRVLVGDEAFEGEDVGLLLCYPNPANRQRMVAMVAGATPAALYQAVERLSWCSTSGYRWFDYAVFDSRTAGPESCLALGIFDSHWRLPSASAGAAWTGQPSVRDGLLPQHFPEQASASTGQEHVVYLSNVRPEAVDQPCGAVAFDRTQAGGPIRLGGQEFKRGLGVAAPSSVTFVLDGQFQSFTATAGVTAAPADAPAVVFEVSGDGYVLATSGLIRAGQDGGAAAPIETDVTGVRAITLTVRAERGGAATGIDCVWADATVSR